MVGHNSIALYDTFYNGSKKEKFIEMFDVKKIYQLSKLTAKKQTANDSIKTLCNIAFIYFISGQGFRQRRKGIMV